MMLGALGQTATSQAMPSNYMIDDAGNLACTDASGAAHYFSAHGGVAIMQQVATICPPVYRAMCILPPSAPCPASQPNCPQTLGGQQPATGNPPRCPAGWTLSGGTTLNTQNNVNVPSTNPLSQTVTLGNVQVPVLLLLGGAVLLLFFFMGGRS